MPTKCVLQETVIETRVVRDEEPARRAGPGCRRPVPRSAAPSATIVVRDAGQRLDERGDRRVGIDQRRPFADRRRQADRTARRSIACNASTSRSTSMMPTSVMRSSIGEPPVVSRSTKARRMEAGGRMRVGDEEQDVGRREYGCGSAIKGDATIAEGRSELSNRAHVPVPATVDPAGFVAQRRPRSDVGLPHARERRMRNRSCIFACHPTNCVIRWCPEEVCGLYNRAFTGMTARRSARFSRFHRIASGKLFARRTFPADTNAADPGRSAVRSRSRRDDRPCCRRCSSRA